MWLQGTHVLKPLNSREVAIVAAVQSNPYNLNSRDSQLATCGMLHLKAYKISPLIIATTLFLLWVMAGAILETQVAPFLRGGFPVARADTTSHGNASQVRPLIMVESRIEIKH